MLAPLLSVFAMWKDLVCEKVLLAGLLVCLLSGSAVII